MTTTAPNRSFALDDKFSLMFMAVTKDDYDLWFTAPDDEADTLVRAGHLAFQSGPIGEFGVNGITNELLIEVLMDRIHKLHAIMPCRENLLVEKNLGDALFWLKERTRKRREQGVEGTGKAHK